MGRKFYGFNNRFRTTKNPYYRSAYNVSKRRK